MPSRYPLLFLLTGLFVILGLLFRQFVLANFIMPVATVIWLMLRIFVLSVDQQVAWSLLIILLILLALFRHLGAPAKIKDSQLPDSNPALNRASNWQDSIRANVRYTGQHNVAKQNLIALLASTNSTNQHGARDFETREALRKRQIDLPDPVYTFLFADEPIALAPSFFEHPADAVKQRLQSMRMAPRKWIRRWTGRVAADYYTAMSEVLTLMEISLEMKNDDEPIDTRDYSASR